MKPAALAWWIQTWPETLAFIRACGRPQQAQQACLREIVQAAQGSQFGIRYRLRPEEDADTFRGRVPLQTYADLSQDVQKVAEGETGVLTASPTLLLEPTSNTGGAGPKWIPYTALLKRQFQRGIAAWMGNLFWNRPQLLGGKHFWSITPPPRRPQYTRGGLPLGFEEDSAYLGGWSRRLVNSLMAVPAGVAHQSDYLGATLSHLLACPGLRLVSVWSPTYWLLLLERLQAEYGLTSSQAWPQLACLSCWGDGYSSRYLEPLQRSHPGLWIQKKGLIATEAFVSLPWVGQSGALLSLRSHFFEFLDGQGRSHLAHELSQGQIYSLVVTTGGGLYRYRLGDRVKVLGFWRDCPRLCFEGREGMVVDRFGEKLSAEHLSLPEGLAWVAYEPRRRAYTLFAQGASLAAGRIEAELRKHNFHYDLCRQLGQLEALAAFELAPGALEAFYRRLQALGTRPGDFKPLPLRPEEDWSLHLPGDFCDSVESLQGDP